MKKVVFLISLFNLLSWNIILFSQEVPHSVSNTGIYNFLDELANNQVIEINSAVKPYSRLYIANKLKEAEEKKEQLNTRQQKELEFYMLDFGKEAERGGEEENGRVGDHEDCKTARPQVAA